MTRLILMVVTLIVLAISCAAFAQQQSNLPVPAREPEVRPPTAAPLLWREDWKVVPGLPTEHPLTQAGVGNANLEVRLYGVDGKDIQENGTGAANSPMHLWTGLCENPCAATLRDKNNYADLTGGAKIRWNIKVSGFHKAQPFIKLLDGTYLVGDHGDGTVSDYHVYEFSFSDARWIKVDPNKVWTRGNLLDKDKVDLSKVDEIGFAELYPGSGHGDGGYLDIGWIEVYGKAVKREGARQ
jgi:hypothetical protein